MERISFTDIKRRVSWGSIFGGVITVLSVSILLSILGTSIGLFMLDPTSSDPASGIGTTVGIWTAVALIISLGAGGFVAGKLSGVDGIIHGFLVWGTTLIVTVILVAMLAVGAVRLTSNVLGAVSSVAGSVVSGVGSAVQSGVSGIGDRVQDVFEDIDFNTETDGENVRQDIRTALRRTGVREFQPEYLRNQLQSVRRDLDRSIRRLVRNPNDADAIISSFTSRLGERAESFANNIDRDDLTQAIANNSNLSRAEVDRMVDEYIVVINDGIEQARERIDSLRQSVEDARQELQTMKQDALEAADKATNAAATSALISFFALLIGAGICAFAGSFGTRKTKEGYEV